MVLFLSSEMAFWVVGQTIPADGGTLAVDSPNGSVAVTPLSLYKPGCWILIRPAGSEAFGTRASIVFETEPALSGMLVS